MRSIVLLALVACTSESPWPRPTLEPLPDDPRLGTIVEREETSNGADVTAAMVADDVWIAIAQYGTPARMYRVRDLANPQIYRLPDAPAFEQAKFGVAWTPGVVVFGNSVWNGAGWTATPWPPNPVSHRPEWIARSPTEVIVANQYWNGVTWQTLPIDSASPSTLGPWDSSGIRVITTPTLQQLCTSVLNLATLTFGSETCTSIDGLAYEVHSAQNGIVDDFMVVVDTGISRFYRFHSGAWTAGDEYPRGYFLDPAPGSPMTTTAANHPYIDFRHQAGVVEVRDARVTRRLFPQFEATLTCTCDRSQDPACPCATGLVYPQIVFNREHTMAAMVVLDVIDNRRTVYARGVPVPLAESPFLPAIP